MAVSPSKAGQECNWHLLDIEVTTMGLRGPRTHTSTRPLPSVYLSPMPLKVGAGSPFPTPRPGPCLSGLRLGVWLHCSGEYGKAAFGHQCQSGKFQLPVP